MQSGKKSSYMGGFFIYMKRLQGRHVLQNPTQHVALELFPALAVWGWQKGDDWG